MIMDDDVFADTTFGRLALEKIKDKSPDFRLYSAEIVGDDGGEAYKVTGSEFTRAKIGQNKGKLTRQVKSTKKTVYVTFEECRAAERAVKPKEDDKK